MKKLLIVNIASGFGGAEKAILQIIKALKNNYQIKFIIENNIFENLLRQENIDYEVISTGSLKKISGIFKFIYAVIKLLLIYLRFQPDLVISNTIRSHILASTVSFITKKKLIWILRDFQFNKKIKSIFHNIPFKIVCVSEVLKNFYMGNEKYIVIPDSLDINQVKCNEIKKNKIFTIGIASNFSRWKGIEYLVSGFKEFKKEINSDNIKLIIAGKPLTDGENKIYYDEIKDLAKDEKNIEFFGWCDNIYDFINQCDVIVSSSVSSHGGPESFGLTILEAWALKKAVIATNVGGPKELIENYKDGILVEEKSSQDIKNALIFLYKNREILFSLGENGYNKLINSYILEKNVIKYKNLINELVG